MGYTLEIGEVTVDYDNSNEDPYIMFDVNRVEDDNAPAFGEPTDHTNQRWPSYAVWDKFCTSAGIHDLMFSKDRDDALLSNHPGCVPLTEQHRSEINDALVAFKIKYPDAIATYGEKQENSLIRDENNPEENSVLCRLTWLHYWINWALDNCEKPVFKNS